ncbi:MAG: hypothetical protein AB1341_09435 [Bacillota bacterium]|nr:hypothetical protein [Gammaproteobacteria bacterium]
MRIFFGVVYVTVLSMVGLSFNSTYSIFNTLARTPTSEAVTAKSEDILKIEKESPYISETSWKNNYTVTNVSNHKIWVYFSIEGSLGFFLQHINPVCIQPGESYTLPVRPVNIDQLQEKFDLQVNELGLLGWRNNNREFTGKITARIFNNFAGYEICTITVTGAELYDELIQQDDPNGDIARLKTVQDILKVLEENVNLKALIEQLTKKINILLEEKQQLEEKNIQLLERIYSLESSVESLNESLSGANRQIEELENTIVNPEMRTIEETPANPGANAGTSPDTSEGSGSSNAEQPVGNDNNPTDETGSTPGTGATDCGSPQTSESESGQ